MDDLLDTGPCGFLTLRDDGSIEAVNATLLTWLGQSREGLLDHHVDAVLPVASRIFFQTHIFPLLKLQGRAEEIYLSLRSADGTQQPVLLNAVRRERTGQHLSDCVVVPMRQRHKFEEEILQSRRMAEEALAARDSAIAELGLVQRDLEKQVLERTTELQTRNEELETFVYTASHDLRQPLLSIAGMSELLDEAVNEGNDGDVAFLLKRVNVNVARMQSLLDDLLRLSRAGRTVEAPEALPLGATVQRVLDELSHRLNSQDVAVEAPSEWPVVLYSPTDLYQVVANLLGNAAKWAGQTTDGRREPPRVRLAWTHSGGVVTLSVEDNGPGIAREYREKVFDLFQKVDARAEGTGVGLAIVRRTVERHGGHAWVGESDLGGAAFCVTLPSA
jgi:sigma-B regulation protein RsbU (phosphoserine phosphatase)